VSDTYWPGVHAVVFVLSADQLVRPSSVDADDAFHDDWSHNDEYYVHDIHNWPHNDEYDVHDIHNWPHAVNYLNKYWSSHDSIRWL